LDTPPAVATGSNPGLFQAVGELASLEAAKQGLNSSTTPIRFLKYMFTTSFDVFLVQEKEGGRD
jgi:hypothetical protein